MNLFNLAEGGDRNRDVVASRLSALSQTGAMVLAPPVLDEHETFDAEGQRIGHELRALCLGARWGQVLSGGLRQDLVELEAMEPEVRAEAVEKLKHLALAKVVAALLTLPQPEVEVAKPAVRPFTMLVDQLGGALGRDIESPLQDGGPNLMNVRPSRKPAWLGQEGRAEH